MKNDTQSNCSWYVPLNVPFKKPIPKVKPKFHVINFFLDTGAIICILHTQKTQSWNAKKTSLSLSKCELKQFVHTKSRNANSELLPTEGVVRLALFPLRDHQATLTNPLR